MEFDLKDVLNAAGPTATLLFASWIFLGYLNSRLSDAQKRFNQLVQEFRQHSEQDTRHEGIYDQIEQNRRRCTLMFRATNYALRAAYFMFATITTGILAIAIKQPLWLSCINICCAMLGIALLVLAVGKALEENGLLHQSVQAEIEDIPEFRNSGPK